MMSKVRSTFLVLFLISTITLSAQNWESIFNGKNLDGWEVLEGSATYEVVDGVIVGTATAKSKSNTFLCTEQLYGDFIFETEVLLPADLNSGIQFRSEVNQKGGVFGYQFELDPSPRKWTGGIYDEKRRQWLYPLTRNPEAKDAFRLGHWNKIRIECLGNEINTFINGQHCSRIVDDETSEGFMGLQVHQIPESKEGNQVMWKNLQVLTENVADHLTPADPNVPQINYLKNELTRWERGHGFRLLWDGKTGDGWRGAKLDGFPESGWTIADGVLTISETDGGEATGPGDIVTTKMYSDFELLLEFKMAEGANSGIKYFVDPTLNKGSGSAIGCEFQILDDKNHPDAKAGVMGNRTLGSLYDMIAAGNLSTPGRSKPFKGIGEWNQCRIVSRDGKIEHWLNNEKVVAFDRYSQIFQALVNYSKYQKWKNFGQWPEGSILLQDHGNEVSFRSIKIREF